MAVVTAITGSRPPSARGRISRGARFGGAPLRAVLDDIGADGAEDWHARHRGDSDARGAPPDAVALEVPVVPDPAARPTVQCCSSLAVSSG
jgi:hypothetical protein